MLFTLVAWDWVALGWVALGWVVLDCNNALTILRKCMLKQICIKVKSQKQNLQFQKIFNVIHLGGFGLGGFGLGGFGLGGFGLQTAITEYALDQQQIRLQTKEWMAIERLSLPWCFGLRARGLRAASA